MLPKISFASGVLRYVAMFLLFKVQRKTFRFEFVRACRLSLHHWSTNTKFAVTPVLMFWVPLTAALTDVAYVWKVIYLTKVRDPTMRDACFTHLRSSRAGFIHGRGKGVKFVPCLTKHHAMKSYGEWMYNFTRILNLGIRWSWMVSVTLRPFYS
jgi:hypothetical protein